jgi:hypothetical protein
MAAAAFFYSAVSLSLSAFVYLEVLMASILRALTNLTSFWLAPAAFLRELSIFLVIAADLACTVFKVFAAVSACFLALASSFFLWAARAFFNLLAASFLVAASLAALSFSTLATLSAASFF